MNILLIECFQQSIRRNAITRLINQLKPTNSFIIDSIPPEQINIECNLKYFDYKDIHEGVYKFVNWNQIPPLDEKILRKWAHLETEFCWMLERTVDAGNTFFLTESHFDDYTQALPNPYYKGNLEHNERVNLFHKHLRFWSHFLVKNKVDTILYLDNAPHFGYDLIIYNLAKDLNIKTVTDAYAILPNYKVFITDYKSFNGLTFNPEVYHHYDSSKEFATSDFKDEWNRLNKPSKLQIIRSSPPFSVSHSSFFSKVSKKVKHTLRPKSKIITKAFDPKYWYFHLRLKNYKNAEKILLNFYNKNCATPDPINDKYIYIPLHYQPEMTTSPMGGIFANQLLMIQVLAFYLPKGYYVYVKEHPLQKYKHRDIHFYAEILKLSNVKLIPITTNSYELLDHSIAVATVTGTAGWEGLFKDKPFLMFGYHIYQYAPGVYPIRSNADCENALKSILSESQSINRNELKKFMLHIEKNAIKYDIENNLFGFADELLKFLQK